MAASPGIDEIENGLAELSTEELRRVRARIDFLTRGTSSSALPSASSREEELVWDHLRHVVGRCRGKKLPPLSVYRRANPSFEFTERVEALMSFIRTFCKPATTTEEGQFVFLFLRVLSRDLQRRGLPVGPKTLVQSFDRIGDVVDIGFPGYRESGLLPMLVRKFAA